MFLNVTASITDDGFKLHQTKALSPLTGSMNLLCLERCAAVPDPAIMIVYAKPNNLCLITLSSVADRFNLESFLPLSLTTESEANDSMSQSMMTNREAELGLEFELPTSPAPGDHQYTLTQLSTSTQECSHIGI